MEGILPVEEKHRISVVARWCRRYQRSPTLEQTKGPGRTIKMMQKLRTCSGSFTRSAGWRSYHTGQCCYSLLRSFDIRRGDTSSVLGKGKGHGTTRWVPYVWMHVRINPQKYRMRSSWKAGNYRVSHACKIQWFLLGLCYELQSVILLKKKHNNTHMNYKVWLKKHWTRRASRGMLGDPEVKQRATGR